MSHESKVLTKSSEMFVKRERLINIGDYMQLLRQFVCVLSTKTDDTY